MILQHCDRVQFRMPVACARYAIFRFWQSTHGTPSFSAVDLGADNGFDELGWNSVAELPDRGRYYPVTFQPIPTRAEAGNSEEPSMATGYRFGGGVERGVPAMAFAAGDALRLSASR